MSGDLIAANKWIQEAFGGHGRDGSGVAPGRPLPILGVAPAICSTGATSSHADSESSKGKWQTVESPNHDDEVKSSSPILETGGVDTAHFSLYGSWPGGALARLKVQFDKMQLAARNDDPEGRFLTVLEGDTIEMEPTGAKAGQYYHWVFAWDGCRVYIKDRADEHETVPNVRIQIGSLALMRVGLDCVWEAFEKLMLELGFKKSREGLSRVDLCVDLPEINVKEFIALWFKQHVLTRGRKGSCWWDRPGKETSLNLGGNRVKLRIYDKLSECDCPAKLEVLQQKRWGGVLPSCATRVEFQIERECLREKWQIDTLAQFNERLPQLVEWLTDDWIRFTQGPPDRVNKNQSRAVTAPLWVKVQEAFKAWAGKAVEICVIPRRVIYPNVDKLVKQAAGCCKKALAFLGKSISNRAEFLEASYKLMSPYGQSFFRRVETSRKELAAQGIACLDDGCFDGSFGEVVGEFVRHRREVMASMDTAFA